MRVRFLIVIAPLCLLLFPQSLEAAPPRSGPSKALHDLFDAEWEWRLKEHPELATSVGDPRYNDRWTDRSAAAFAGREAHERELLARIRRLDRSRLSPDDQLNYDLFLRNARLDVEGQRFHGEYMPVTQRRGPHQDIPDLIRLAPRFTVKDYDDILKRLEAVPALIDQTLALMRKGLETGIVMPQVILREVGKNIEHQVVSDPTKSPLYQVAYAELPASIPAAEQQRIRGAGAAAIRDAVVPAMRKLHDYFVNDYLPRTRKSIAVSDLPDGKAWYADAIEVLTTTSLPPEEIHQLGLSEVKRIRAEMEAAKRAARFQGDLPAFFQFLRTDPQFFFRDKELLVMAYRDIAKRIDPGLPRLFRTLPRLTYGVIPVPSYSEKTQTTAYYNGGSPEAGRPGYFYCNTYDLASRPKWEMEALTLHEAVPGHHLQIARAQELEGLPQFRRHGGYTAFIEGWGLYAESLGPELGMYQDPYSKFGQLTYEMWRAVRLVVDTGMHAKGWTRDQAIQFFLDNTSKMRHDIEVEIDRYISWPGQALAYKLGELKLKELRAYATRELGERFSVRDFHDQVLGSGPLPLSVLDARLRAWVAGQKH